MYAVIKTGGKQYRVAAGDTLEVEHLSAKEGEASFVPVLVVTDDGKTIYGNSALKEYVVRAKVIGDSKGDKITILKYRPKSGYAAKSGHRQLYSLIEITAIGDHKKPEVPAKSTEPTEAKAKTKTKPKTKAKTEAKTEEKPKKQAKQAEKSQPAASKGEGSSQDSEEAPKAEDAGKASEE